MSFISIQRSLREVLDDAHAGRLQLPDFQRDYVWNDEGLRSLLASVCAGFPMGALLTLESGGPVRFKPRLLESVEKNNPAAAVATPEELLLDGQQRMTSLYQAVYAPRPVTTRNAQGKAVERLYYIDVKAAAANPDALDDAIVGLPADRIERSDFGRKIDRDLSTPEKEFAADMFPLNKAFDWTRWNYDWIGHWQKVDPSRELWSLSETFFKTIISNVTNYNLPIIRLLKGNSRAAICTVFEKVNVGGKKLDAFELVTAIYAADEFDLREDWLGKPGRHDEGRLARMVGASNPRDVLVPLTSVDFLKGCSLMHSRRERARKATEAAPGQALPQVSCSRDAILAVPLSSYLDFADPLEAGFVQAAQFMNARRIIWRGDVPYPNLVTGLATVFATLGHKATAAPAQDKLARWFWSVALSEQYGSSPESRLARDVPEVIAWIADDGPQPRALEEAVFQQNRLTTLRSRQAAGYKALHALMMARGCRDFITGRPAELMTYFSDKIDIHHIFPRAWAKRREIPPRVYNAIVNKTPLSALSNRMVGGDAPSVYLRRIEERQGLTPSQLDDLLRSHLIEPDLLRADDFEGFFAARIEALSGLVHQAMGKPVVRAEQTNEPERETADADDEDEEIEEIAAA